MINKELFEGPVGDYCIARNTIKCLFIKHLFQIKYRAKRAKKMRKLSIWGIKIIGPRPLNPLVVCHAKINSNCNKLTSTILKGRTKKIKGKSGVIIVAIKTLIIRAIIAQNNKIINGRLPDPDSQPVFMTLISD